MIQLYDCVFMHSCRSQTFRFCQSYTVIGVAPSSRSCKPPFPRIPRRGAGSSCGMAPSLSWPLGPALPARSRRFASLASSGECSSLPVLDAARLALPPRRPDAPEECDWRLELQEPAPSTVVRMKLSVRSRTVGDLGISRRSERRGRPCLPRFGGAIGETVSVCRNSFSTRSRLH